MIASDESQRWNPFVLRWLDNPPFATGLVELRGIVVAHVYLAIDGEVATMQDIVVSKSAPVVTWLPLWTGPLRRRNFQRRGIGTRLLAAALEHARGAGAQTIEGIVTAPSPWLIAWYQRHGFVYDPQRSVVQRDLRKDTR